MASVESVSVKCEQAVKRALERAVIVLAALLVLDVAAGVFTRYVLNAALPWTDEMGGYLLGWLGFLGAALLFADDGHIAFELVVDALPKHWQRRIMLGGYMLSIGFFLILAYESVVLMGDLRGSVGISIPIPKPLIYSVIFLASVAATLLLSLKTIAGLCAKG
jgi:TRAP-type C4-dicarboxylate transport system permease small subunit